MFSGTILNLMIQIIEYNISICFSYPTSVVLSNKESYGGETLFGPDTDYFGDRHRTRSNPLTS